MHLQGLINGLSTVANLLKHILQVKLLSMQSLSFNLSGSSNSFGIPY